MSLYYMPKFFEKHPVLARDCLLQLDDLSNVTEKMEKLNNLLEIPEEENKERQDACAKVFELLKKYYPDCLVYMCGSSLNRFGARNALDLLFLPFPEYSNLDYKTPEKSDKSPLPEPASILSGETPRDVLLKLDEWAHLKFIRTALRQDKDHVKRGTFIPSRAPILKVHLNGNKTVCDLMVSNKLIFYNSELLQFFEKLDPRVTPLVTTLRFWARSLGFLKRSFFSKHAFNILVIFFLQSISPPVLPSVQRLIAVSGFNRKISGWETAFTTNERLVEKSKNTKSVSELLNHFFEYYWNFDFVQNVVCPYTGKPLPVKDLKLSKDERMKSFEVSSINIQDPFILSQNVCKTEVPKTIFKLAVNIAYQMLQANEKFTTLFDQNVYQQKLNINYDRYMSGCPKVCFINLDYDYVMKLSKSAKNLQFWYQRISEVIFDVLQYGLLIECEVTDKIPWDKKNAAADKNGVDEKHSVLKNNLNNTYSLDLMLSIQCILYTRTWVGRKNVTEVTMTGDELDEFNDAALKAEHSVSRQLLQKYPAINSHVPLLCFKCDCYKHETPQIADVVVMLKPLTLSKEFYQVYSFLRSYIPKTVKKILTSD